MPLSFLPCTSDNTHLIIPPCLSFPLHSSVRKGTGSASTCTTDAMAFLSSQAKGS